ASDRLKVQRIGESYEGRALYYMILGTPENISRLEELRQNNLKLSDPRRTSVSDAQRIIESAPVFVALTYNVHGDEHSGTEAALAMAYYLLAAKDPQVANVLQNCIVIIDPLQNPDGRERFINYFYQTV